MQCDRKGCAPGVQVHQGYGESTKNCLAEDILRKPHSEAVAALRHIVYVVCKLQCQANPKVCRLAHTSSVVASSAIGII